MSGPTCQTVPVATLRVFSSEEDVSLVVFRIGIGVPFQSTHPIYCDSTQIHKYSNSIPGRSRLDVHLAVSMHEASVYNGVEGG